MTAKQYLRRIRELDADVSSTLEQIEILHAQVTKTTSTLSDMPRGGGDQDKLAGTIAKIVDLKRGLRDKIDGYMDLKARAIEQIYCLEDGRYRQILTLHYINGKSWEEISVAMNYTYRHTTRLHGQALIEFKDVLACPSLDKV